MKHLQVVSLSLFVALLTLVLADGAPTRVFAQGIVYVNKNATGANNGTRWADAYTDLQVALANTSAGEMWVAAGTYTPAGPNGDRNATFQLKNNVALYGGFAGNETARDQRNPAANVTILSGDLNGDDQPGFYNQADNSYHVVTGSGTDATAILDGFTITGGRANASSGYGGTGAGVLIVKGSPTLSGCKIVANEASWGAGLYIGGGSLTITGCEFSGNLAYASKGGGMSIAAGSTATIANSTFTYNRSTGGAAQPGGGAIYNDFGANLTVSNSTFVGNVTDFYCCGGTAPAEGGAILSGGDSFTLTNSILLGNRAHNGGAVAVYGNATLVNDVFSGNRATSGLTQWPTGYGGALELAYLSNKTVKLEGVTLSRNTAVEDAGGVYAGGVSLLIENSILWGNTTSNPDITTFQAQIHGPSSIRYDDIQGVWEPIPGQDPPNCPGCLDADPLFVNAVGDNLRLNPGSPVIDAGDNAGFPAGITTDLDGNARFFDDPATPNTGLGIPPIVDMGAYEFGSGSPAPTPTATPTTMPPTATPTATPTTIPPTATPTSVPPTATPTSCAAKPGKPTLVSPANGATVTVRQVPLDWNPVACAASYKVQVRQDSTSGALADSKTVSTDSYPTKRLARGHVYYWRVRACSAAGCGAWSGYWSFTIQ